jgi:hypothetical protein
MRYYPHFILPMRSSRGFASTAPDLDALFRLAFASATRHNRLTLPMTVSRRIIMQKARHHPSGAVSRRQWQQAVKDLSVLTASCHCQLLTAP